MYIYKHEHIVIFFSKVHYGECNQQQDGYDIASSY